MERAGVKLFLLLSFHTFNYFVFLYTKFQGYLWLKRKHIKPLQKRKKLDEPSLAYKKEKSNLMIFKSFEEQEEYNRLQMANLTPYESLLYLRKMINIAYGMHGYNPDNLPTKHKITIL